MMVRHISVPEMWFGFLQASYQPSSTCVCAVIQKVDYVFAENGLVAYKNGELLSVQVSYLFIYLFIKHVICQHLGC